MKQSTIILLLGLLCGIWQWLAPPQSYKRTHVTESYHWPQSFEGKTLTALTMTDMEREFGKGFPGEIGNFLCGDQQIIMRYVTRATRKLHPAADCLRASGHHIGEVKIHADMDGNHWAGCEAVKAGQRLFLRERIVEIGNVHAEWSDVSSWYWHALLAPDEGPWLAITVISQVDN